MTTAKNIYRSFVAFEERAADIYLRLASHFSSKNPALSALWLEMATQEKQHAGLLQFCVAEESFASELPKEAGIRKVPALFRHFEKHAADPKLDVNGAFELAAELEGSEIDAIYCYLTTPLHRSIYLLKRKIVSSPFDQIDRLVTAGKKFGADQKTIKKLQSIKESWTKVAR